VFLPTAGPSDSPKANSTPAGQPQKKPAGHKVIMAAYLIGQAITFSSLYIHYVGLLPPKGFLPAAKLTLCPTLALSYIGSVTARHSSSGRQPNFAAWYKQWNYGLYRQSEKKLVKPQYLLHMS